MRKPAFLVVFLSLVAATLLGVTGPFTKKVAFTTNRDGNFEIYKMNENGSVPARVTNDPASDTQPAWSPDGTKLAFVSTRNGGFDIFIVNADGTGVDQLTDDPGFDLDPVFSPDGNKIFFISSRDGNNEVYSMNVDGTSQTRITNNTLFEVRPDVSPNGAKLVVARNVPDNGGFSQQIVIMNTNGSSPVTLTSLGSNHDPVFSADGKRIFFHSQRDGTAQIYSMKIDGSNQVRLTFDTGLTDAAPTIQSVFEQETVGVYRPTTGEWILDLQAINGPKQAPVLDIRVTFGGLPGDLPVAGDWNGDGRTDIGIFRSGTFLLGLLKEGPVLSTVVEAQAPFSHGLPGDLPIAGDWNGDGKDEVGVFRPGATGTFLLRLQQGQFITFGFGTTGDLPVAGDWNGDGIDTPGVFRPGDSGTFLLTNTFANDVDFNFTFGSSDSLPVAGDWLATGRDGVGIFAPSFPVFILAQELFGKGGFVVNHGQPGDLPVAGSWAP